MILRGMISLHRKLLGRAVNVGVRSLSTGKVFCKSHYETLGVKPDASLAEIKNAYFKLSKIYHPDRIAATDENLAKFREISNAYEVLGNEHSRKLYDIGLLDKSAGLDVVESDDPIIKFYKQKQDLEKSIKTQATEMDAWTRTYYKEARQKVIRQNDFFKSSKAKVEEKENMVSYHLVWLGTVFLAVVVLYSNIEHHPFEKIKRRIFS